MKKLFVILVAAMLVSCQQYKVLIVQDYRKENGKWIKTGEPYVMPDTIQLIHAFVWIKGNKIYPY